MCHAQSGRVKYCKALHIDLHDQWFVNLETDTTKNEITVSFTNSLFHTTLIKWSNYTLLFKRTRIGPTRNIAIGDTLPSAMDLNPIFVDTETVCTVTLLLNVTTIRITTWQLPFFQQPVSWFLGIFFLAWCWCPPWLGSKCKKNAFRNSIFQCMYDGKCVS